MIAEILNHGENNAITGRDLAALLNCGMRDIATMAEKERRCGAPICAKCNGAQSGYYLAANAEELADYIGRLHHRERELAETRAALVNTLAAIAEK